LWGVLAVFVGLAGWVRVRILGRALLPGTLAVVGAGALVLVLFSRVSPWAGGRPGTLLFWATFFHGVAAFLIFGLERVAAVWARAKAALPARRGARLGVQLLSAYGAVVWFSPEIFNSVVKFLRTYEKSLWVILPLATGLWRRRRGRAAGYLQGMACYVIAAVLLGRFVETFLSRPWGGVLYVWAQRVWPAVTGPVLFKLVSWFLPVLPGSLVPPLAGAWAHLHWEELARGWRPEVLRRWGEGAFSLLSRVLKGGAAWLEKVQAQGGDAVPGAWVKYRRWIFRSALAVAGLGAAGLGVSALNRALTVRVTEFTPSGLAREGVVVRVAFSKPVRWTGAGTCFEFSPPLAGSVRQDAPDAVVFVPDGPLAPSTRYKAVFRPEGVTSARRVQSRAVTEFFTARFAVEGARLYYEADFIDEDQLRVMGEVRFNGAVAPGALQGAMTLTREGKAVPFTVERSLHPSLYYFKTGLMSRLEEGQKINLSVAAGLKGEGGALGLEKAFDGTLVLPARPKPQVAEVKLWHEPGNTFVTVLFNMPVSKEEIQRHLSVVPPVPLTVDTEYAYAVLRGDFKPNTHYKVVVEKGLIARSGQVMGETFTNWVRIQDQPARVAFARKGNVLALSGPKTLAVTTVNMDRVNVRVQKVYRSNLSLFLNRGPWGMSKDVFNGAYAVEGGTINEELTQYVDLTRFQDEPYKGLFQVEVRDPKDYSNRDDAWVLCTDLGLLAKESGEDLWVYVLGVESLRPLPGTSVELYSQDNQVMERVSTDESGRAVFRDWRRHPYKLVPFFVVASRGEDFSFMRFNQYRLNNYQFAVGGARVEAGALDAFLTPERGVYRPGETVHLTALVRSPDARVNLSSLPLRVTVTDPRGREVNRFEERPNVNGLSVFRAEVPRDALTGEYTAALARVDTEKVLGRVGFKVEEFLPDKLRVSVHPEKKVLGPGEALSFTVRAEQLFGAPAAGNRVEAQVRWFAAPFRPKGYEEYSFADGGEGFAEQFVNAGQEATDAKGERRFTVETPSVRLPAALKAYIYAEAFDTGGRPVSGAESVEVRPFSRYVGISASGTAPVQGATVTLRAVALDAGGKPVSVEGVRWVVKRSATYSIFRRSFWGRTGYQSSSYQEVVENRIVNVKGKGSLSFRADKPGEYTVLLASPEGMRAGVTVHVAGGEEGGSLETPEKLGLSLDKASYEPGETARVLVKAPFPGRLMLSLERENVLETRVVEMAGREAVVTFAVGEEAVPNVYVVGLLARRPEETKDTLPMVSFGVENLTVKTTSKKVALEWETPATARSSEGVEAVVKVAGAPEETDVVLAAVDEGVLQVTQFETPDPLNYFFRKRALATETYTMLDLLLPDLLHKKSALGGGDGGEFSRRHLNPVAAKKKRSLAFVAGPLTPDAEGRVRHRFDTRGFNGEVRLMALAVRRGRYGAAARAVKVADPIVLEPSLPRVAAPKDQFLLPVQVFNKTGRDGTVAVSLGLSGPLAVEGEGRKSVEVKKESGRRVVFALRATNDAGVGKVTLTAEGNGTVVSTTEELAVRPANPLRTTVKTGSLAGGGSVDLPAPGGTIPFGQKVRVSLSANPLILYLRSLDYLITYPHGCAEQVVSGVFPLLYMKDLGYATGRFGDKAGAVELFVHEGIKKLERLQRPNGDFAYWPGSDRGDYFLTLYASHFLWEARRLGYAVKPATVEGIRRFLRKGQVSVYVREDEEGGEGEVWSEEVSRLDRRGQNILPDHRMDPYLLFVKALVGEPDREAMTAKSLPGNLKNLGESDRAFLSAAYSTVGDREAALKILTPDFKSRWVYREQFGSFNSPARNTALYLMALAMADPASARVNEVVEYLGGLVKDGHFGSTQENAWVMMALSRVFAERNGSVAAEVLVDGKPWKTAAGREAGFDAPELSGKTLTFLNKGEGRLYYYVMAEGTPLAKRTESVSEGLRVARVYRNAKGETLNLGSVPQGELVVVTVTVAPKKDPVHNLVVVDVLPAGLEVENTRLRSQGELGFAPPGNFPSVYQDIRDDRLIFYAGELTGEASFSYTARAVTPGRFDVPGAFAEAMYDPEIRAEEARHDPLVIAENNAGR
jgi:uncharacterized protein YfaS (alpha-2-macroglobulin family)